MNPTPQHLAELQLHALQLTERLRRAQLEHAIDAVPWGSFVCSPFVVERLGIRERWVLDGEGGGDGGVGSGMRWVRVPMGRSQERERKWKRHQERGDGVDSRAGVEMGADTHADADWQRWWSGSFGRDMWELCDQVGKQVFPGGVWGECAIDGIDMCRYHINFTPLTPLSLPSCISTPCTPGGTKHT